MGSKTALVQGTLYIRHHWCTAARYSNPLLEGAGDKMKKLLSTGRFQQLCPALAYTCPKTKGTVHPKIKNIYVFELQSFGNIGRGETSSHEYNQRILIPDRHIPTFFHGHFLSRCTT